jgi:hypothetical protein
MRSTSGDRDISSPDSRVRDFHNFPQPRGCYNSLIPFLEPDSWLADLSMQERMIGGEATSSSSSVLPLRNMGAGNEHVFQVK